MLSIRVRMIGLMLLIVGAFTGCGGDGITYSRGRLFNALVAVSNPTQDPQGSAIDFQVSPDPPGLQNIPFGAASAYFTVRHGSIEISALQRGTSTLLLPRGNVDLLPDHFHTIVTLGVVNTQGTSLPQFINLVDTLPTIPATMAALRIVNASPDSAPVDLFSGDKPASPILGLTNVSYSHASNYVLVPSGATILTVHTSRGGDLIPTKTLAQGTTLNAGSAYTVFVVGMRQPLAPQEAFDARIVPDN